MTLNSHYHNEISSKLKRYYIIALTSVALFSIIGQIVVQYAIYKQRSDATVINLAGRQRMLSQRICKNILMLSPQNIYMKDSTEKYKNDLIEIIPKWENVHIGLRNKRLELPNAEVISVRNSIEVVRMLEEIHPAFLKMLESAKQISRFSENANEDSLFAKTQEILKYERIFLATMDKVVFQYDKEAKAQIESLKKLELYLFIFTIMILVVEGIFIFKPLHQQVRRIISILVDSEAHLYNVNYKLQKSNEILEKTQKELLRTTEEKYKLELKEGMVRSASLIEGQEEERKRIAFELHDGIGQMLTGLKLTSERILEDNLQTDKEKKALADLKSLINDTISETRTISFNLAPSVLNDFGLYSAVKILTENAAKSMQIDIQLIFDKLEKRFPSNIEISSYRIIQEAINNILKHADATKVEIKVKSTDLYLEIMIIDNGKGFDLKKYKNKTARNGINNMQSRAELNLGEFKITSSYGKGTKIFVKLPLKTHTNY